LLTGERHWADYRHTDLTARTSTGFFAAEDLS
jgi:hypothetical protein